MILLYHRACKIPINLWLVFCAKKGSQLGALVSHGPADVQLGVQLVDVLLNRSLREVECFGDLLVGAALGHQPGKGQLFLGQCGGNGRAVCRAVELGAPGLVPLPQSDGPLHQRLGTAQPPCASSGAR